MAFSGDTSVGAGGAAAPLATSLQSSNGFQIVNGAVNTAPSLMQTFSMQMNGGMIAASPAAADPRNTSGARDNEPVIRTTIRVPRFVGHFENSLNRAHLIFIQTVTNSANHGEESVAMTLPIINYMLQAGQMKYGVFKGKFDAQDPKFMRRYLDFPASFVYGRPTIADADLVASINALPKFGYGLADYAMIAGVAFETTGTTGNSKGSNPVRTSLINMGQCEAHFMWPELKTGTELLIATVRVPRVQHYDMHLLPLGNSDVAPEYGSNNLSISNDKEELDDNPFIKLPCVRNPRWNAADPDAGDSRTELPVIFHPRHWLLIKSGMLSSGLEWKDFRKSVMLERVGFLIHAPRQSPNDSDLIAAPFDQAAMDRLPIAQIFVQPRLV
jgi:hypothetical protein